MVAHLLIRCDADTQIGSGHLMRCLALAQAWQAEGGTVTFLSRCESDALRRRIRSAGLNFASMDEPHPDASDLRQTLGLLEQLATVQAAGCWLVLDGYHFDSVYQQSIRAAGHRLLVVDDMAHLPHYHADLVLNQNIHAERLTYHCDSDTELLLGSDYSMLRPEFQSWRGWQRETPHVARKVLVSLGSGDPDNVTLKVIQALQQTEISNLEARVVVGPANQHLETLRKATAHSTSIELLVDVTQMAELMAWADLAVSAGGSTCWELAFMGLPSVVVVLAENQIGTAQGLDEVGAVLNLGWYERISVEQIRKALCQLMRAPAVLGEMSRRGQELVDGDGVKRLVSKLKGACIILRAMSVDDCRLVWEWANDPGTRASSFSPNPIPWERHKHWFESKLRDPNCLYYMALNSAGESIGQVRYDRNGSEAVISVSLGLKYRCSGYGSLIIQRASQKVFSLVPVSVIHAYIKKENEASAGAFAKAGYKEEHMTKVCEQEARHLTLAKEE